MIHSRFAGLMLTLILLISGTGMYPAPTEIPRKPTQKQLDAAIEAFKAVGGRLEKDSDPQSMPIFRMGDGTDEDLKKLPDVPFLFGLNLGNSQVTDAGLKELASLKNLSALELDHTKVTNAGMKELTELKYLQALSLWSTKITDVGLKEIAKLKNLSWLLLDGSNRVPACWFGWLGKLG
jgi:internalin A